MARRIFEFDGKSWEEGIDPAMTVREVQQDLAYYYPLSWLVSSSVGES